jgi:hypothetical protein
MVRHRQSQELPSHDSSSKALASVCHLIKQSKTENSEIPEQSAMNFSTLPTSPSALSVEAVTQGKCSGPGVRKPRR